MWISQNVPATDLIFNDPTWNGYYLPSYVFKQVIFHYYPHPSNYYIALTLITDPYNETSVKQTLQILNISWIYLSSDPRYFDAWMYGGDSQYKEKPYSPTEYLAVFDSYTFLDKRFQLGNSTVYKVTL